MSSARIVFTYLTYGFIQIAACLPMLAHASSEEEGRWVGRAKLGITLIDSSEKEYVSGVPVNRTPAGVQLFDGNVSGEIEADYFVYDRLSVGASIGYLPQPSATWTFGGRTDSGNVAAIPLAANAKLHIAPYGIIRPYVTAGYHYSFFSTSYKTFSFESSSGPVIGGGFDWWFYDNVGMNIEAKQYFMETEVDRSKLTLDNSITEAEINPMVISVGLAYRF